MKYYEIYTGKDTVEEIYSYSEFVKRIKEIHKTDDSARGYCMDDNEKNNRVYYFSGNKLVSESNYFDN